MISIKHHLAAVLVLTMAVSTAARAGEPVDYSTKSDAELAAILQESRDRLLKDACGTGEPLLGELYSRHHEDGVLRGLLLARVLCADDRGDFRGAADQLDAYEQRFDSLIDLGLYLDYRVDDADAMLARLGRLAKATDAQAFAGLSPERYSAALRQARRQGRLDDFDRVALQLFENRGFAEFEADLQSSIARRSLEPAIAEGRLELVPELLGFVRSPFAYSELLSSRDYTAAWPAIEQRVGEHYEAITRTYREWAEARLANEPAERDRFSDAAHALYFDGQFEKAAALARSWRERPGAFDRIEEGDGWAINIEAYSLDALGRTAEADALFDKLAGLDPDEYPWVVNFVINRASRLVGQRRFSEALEAANLARTVAEEPGSTYAKMLVAHDHACAYAGLGRAVEAEPELAYLRENRTEALTVAAETLMCLGRDDEALAMVLEGIEGEATRADAIDGLLPETYDLFYTQSLLPDTSRFLDTSPELRAAFERHARSIPDRFVPAASLKRVPLKR